MQVLQSRVLLRPRDFERSVDFYETRLGLVRYRDCGEAPHRGVVYFLGGGFLELTDGAGRERRDGSSRTEPVTRHLCVCGCRSRTSTPHVMSSRPGRSPSLLNPSSNPGVSSIATVRPRSGRRPGSLGPMCITTQPST
jgi:hypothetical protein